jgi:HD superfamily phosphohydrolase YqeK
MSFPTNSKAEELLAEASLLNPGDWVQHNRVAGNCARIIASRCEGMDEQRAYVLGLLHDIGRRFGVNDLKHTSYGYNFMLEQGYNDCAKICLTHPREELK